MYLSDLDIVNHVNNVKYLEWCLDYTAASLLLKQQLQSLEMNFLKELSLKDEVEILKQEDDHESLFNITKEGKTCFALQLNWK